MDQNSLKMLEFALFYSKIGWHVFPVHGVRGGVCTCRNSACTAVGKHPATIHGVRDATCQETEVRSFFDGNPSSNIGIATGLSTFVLDIDDKKDGSDSLAKLESRYGSLPTTVEAITGNGRHLYFQAPASFKIPNRVGIEEGIDVRGHGGYVVAPPSTHANGNQYVWSCSGHPEDIPAAPAPDWLFKVIAGDQNQVAKTSGDWSLLLQQCREGTRNATIASIAGHLLRRYVDPGLTLELIKGLNQTLCRPPLTDHEITRTVQSISKKELARRTSEARNA